MNEYIFTTTEGTTLSPNLSDVENCQVLARVVACNVAEARTRLFDENQWIIEVGFSPEKIILNQVLTQEQIIDIRIIINYLWEAKKLSDVDENSSLSCVSMALHRLSDLVPDGN